MSSVILKPEIKDEDDDISIIESMPLRYLTPLPEGRHKELQTFPEFVPDVDESVVFSRAFLSASLGGSHQPLIVKYGIYILASVDSFSPESGYKNPWQRSATLESFWSPISTRILGARFLLESMAICLWVWATKVKPFVNQSNLTSFCLFRLKADKERPSR
jgi:hypothetical protein